MERLTYRDKKGKAHIFCKQMCADAENCTDPYSVDLCQRFSAFSKLAEYEDLEEQGRLLRLPCDIGTRVYKPFIVVCREKPWIFSPNIDVHYITLEDLPEMGKKVFLTSQEADIKLNSMVEEYKASLEMEESHD